MSEIDIREVVRGCYAEIAPQRSGSRFVAHERLMAELISSGDAKNTQNRSPSVPAGRMTGVPPRGPRSLESILKRRAPSKKSTILPSAMVTEYAPREYAIERTWRSVPTDLRSGNGPLARPAFPVNLEADQEGMGELGSLFPADANREYKTVAPPVRIARMVRRFMRTSVTFWL
jgi:hypothetical protein